MRNTLLFFSLLLLCISLHAQPSTPPRVLPDWVAMIDNPSTNYFEAINAFDSFWADKEKPREEEEMEAGEEDRNQPEQSAAKVSMTPGEREYNVQLAYHAKRFINWIHEMKPYVQPDGRILNMDERMNIWYRQQAELKENQGHR